MKPPVVAKSRIKSELPSELPLFRWMYKKHHPSNPAPDGHDYDGQPAIPLITPDYITEVKRWRVERIDNNGELILMEDPQGPIFEALQANQEVATEEFWRAMKTAARSVK
jgi:hypothetical protein